MLSLSFAPVESSAFMYRPSTVYVLGEPTSNRNRPILRRKHCLSARYRCEVEMGDRRNALLYIPLAATTVPCSSSRVFYILLVTRRVWNAKGARLIPLLFPTAKQAGDAELGEITWTVTTQQFSLSKFPVFFFALGPTAALDNAWTSHYFNITKGPASTTTTSSTATTSSSTTTSGGTSSSVVSSATTSTTASTTSGQPGSAITVSVQSSSSGAEQIGLGVGLGIGIPIVLLLAALVAFIVYRSRRKNKRSRAESPSYQSDNGIRMKTYNHAPNGTRLSDEQQADLLIRSQPAELPSRRISTRLAELPSR